MSLEKIISVSGQPGLFKVISQTNYGLIAESLETAKRIPVYSSYKVSSLEDISIYAESEDIPLKEIFFKIFEKESGNECDIKTDAEAKTYFESILPEYDRERVYVSDIKKVYKWYNLLIKHDLLKPEENVVEATEEGEKKKKEPKTKAETAKAAKIKANAAKPAPRADSKSKGGTKINTPRKAQ